MTRDDTDPKALRALAEASAGIDHTVSLHPARLLALLDRLDAAEAKADRLDDTNESLWSAQMRAETAERERDEARAACIRAEEDHRAAVESLETYESRIRDIADNVLGIRPPDVATIVLLDAIERRCGEERIAARQAEAEVARLRRIEEAAAELVAIIPRPVDGHARSTNLVLVADMLRDALKEGKSDEQP